ncbi:xyloglucan endotransglucosylase protein 1-like [Mercurialis annua]|uniref:xyloglucan endotransglucosylase protein 1-like n=1 Tax=Mercurialis annua TaxID=3986 RepID=UPI00215E3D5F|nr:xyloglucan endotransglucosylase protein 1-like [Mercurialis annua]
MSPLFLLSGIILSTFVASCAGNFYQDVAVTWGNGRGKILNGGNLLSLSLDKESGSGFQTNQEYLYAKFDVQMKLVPGNSAGTVTTFYLSSPPGGDHDEIDLEFLGNSSGSPYTLHTNVYVGGKGNREQEFNLWFDPTQRFHLYTILWSPHRIILLVDNIPIRVFENKIGVPYPKTKPMSARATLWDADQWATQGGRVKTDWSKAPFTAYYSNLNIQTTRSVGSKAWLKRGLSRKDRKWIRWVRKYHMIYDYCNRSSGIDRRECLKF